MQRLALFSEGVSRRLVEYAVSRYLSTYVSSRASLVLTINKLRLRGFWFITCTNDTILLRSLLSEIKYFVDERGRDWVLEGIVRQRSYFVAYFRRLKP